MRIFTPLWGLFAQNGATKRPLLLNGEGNCRDVLVPGHGELAFISAHGVEGDFERLDGRRRLGHVHLDASEIRALVVRQSPFAGLLADDETPIVGAVKGDEKRVGTGRNFKIVNVEIASCSSASRNSRRRRYHAESASGADRPFSSPLFNERSLFRPEARL